MYNTYTKNKIGFVDAENKRIAKHPITNPYDFSEHTVFIDAYETTDEAVYSDRLYQWNSDKFNFAMSGVKGTNQQMFHNLSPSDIEKFLYLYYGDNLKLTKIRYGCNVGNGYPYWVFFFRRPNEN